MYKLVNCARQNGKRNPPGLQKIGLSAAQMTSSQNTCTRDYFGLSIVLEFVVMISLDRLNQNNYLF